MIRKIDEQLPTIDDARLHAFLLVMRKGHDINIRAVDDALKEGLA